MARSELDTPPQPAILFTDTTKSVAEQIEEINAQRRTLINSIVSQVTPETATFSNVSLPMALFSNAISSRIAKNSLLCMMAPDAEVRDACVESEQLLDKSLLDATMREDIFALVKVVYDKQKNDPSLSPESRRLLGREYQEYIRAGMEVPEGSKRQRFKQIQDSLTEITSKCCQNISEEHGELWFTPGELQGVPNDVLETFSKGESGSQNEGKLKVTFEEPDMIPVLTHCTVTETRKAVQGRADQILELRDEAARLLGFPDDATFALQDKMFGNPQKVNKFLQRLQSGLTAQGEKEIARLKALKRSHGIDEDWQHYYHWDHRYYSNLMELQEYDLDQKKLAEYFPLDASIANMLKIFQDLFGLDFVEVRPGPACDRLSSTGKGEDLVWHADVKLFTVWDDDGSFVGYLYFDLHPREENPRDTMMVSTQSGFLDAGGQRTYPAATMLCNFTKPTATKPSLLKHEEMVTLFHELGHAIHELVSRTSVARFHGIRGSKHFTEAPSQMLENWCWTPSTLRVLSQHWSHLSAEYRSVYLKTHDTAVSPDEKMPDAMIDSLIRTRYVNSALANLRQLHFAMFDQIVHSPKSHGEIVKLDASRLYNKLRQEVYPLDDLGDADDYHWAHPQATFIHIIGGMNASYYGYQASLVYSSDMFETAFSKDPMNREAGRRYQRMVLVPGGSKDEMEMLTDFLGREPSDEAYCRRLGLAR